MGTVNVTLGDDTRLNLLLGRQMENDVTEVVFDFSAWATAYGSGTLALSVQRPGDTQPYAVVLSVSGTDATWSISSLDTAYKGIGEIQLTYTVGTAVKKSVIYKFTVYQSLGENGEYPSPGQTWQEEIEDELSDVRADLENIRNGKVTLTLSARTGMYCERNSGAINSNANYSALFVDNNARIKIPEFCKRIEFDIVVPPGGANGWATYSINTGSSTAAFLRGGQSNIIDVQETDKYFCISSYKKNGALVTEFNITFVYDDEINIIDGLENVANLMQSETALMATQGFWVGATDGIKHSIANTRYSATNIVPIPNGVTKIEFPAVSFNTGGTAGWAVYNGEMESGTGTGFLRGGQSNSIEVVDGDRGFALTDYNYSGALTSIPVTYTYGKINEELEQSSRVSNMGYKVVMLGDSLIGNYDDDDSIPSVLSNLTKAECYNCAFGGSSMGSDLVDPDEYLEAFNGWKILNAITTNNYSAQQTAIDNDPTYAHLRANYQTHLDTLKNMDWSTVDVITLSYGTNDWGTKVVLNDDTNPMSTDTFMGAYRTILETLWETYPHIKVLAFGVVWRALSSSAGEVTADSDDGKHGRNWYLREFEEGIETVCNEYHVPFVPMYDYTNFNKYTWSNYFGTDLTHPNAKGRFVMAKRYASFLMQL